MSSVIVWFRRDLRIEDNSALAQASSLGIPVIPVFIWSPEEEAPWSPGSASRWWLHHSLDSLNKTFQERWNQSLTLRSGSSLETLKALASEVDAKFIFWNRLYEPRIRERDEKIKKVLKSLGIEAQSFNSHVLFEPWTIENRHGSPFQVFTPFSKKCLEVGPPEPIKKPASLVGPKQKLKSLDLESLKLLPYSVRWDRKFEPHWEVGEEGARKLLKRFMKSAASEYATGRDIPSVDGTSRLSPHLHFGEIGPRAIWKSLLDYRRSLPSASQRKSCDKYLLEILWREFAHHILYHFPSTSDEPLRADFKKFPWKYDKSAYQAWCKGMTGFPIIDAGMRQLWETGWMHNRVRMIVASLLTKHLLMSWKDGAKWFWDTLVDADLASNSLGWQWAGGCGADAAPYFRIFNPVLQGEKFDPQGDYVKRWVPELKDMPPSLIHKPWTSEKARDHDYPTPIIDLQTGRDRALEAFKVVKK